MTGRDKRPNPPTQEVIRSDVDIRDGGLTWVDYAYDEKLKKALKPPTLPALPTVSYGDLSKFMQARIAELIEAGITSNSAYADEKAARNHFPDHSIPRGWIANLRLEHGAPAAWSKRGRKSNS